MKRVYKSVGVRYWKNYFSHLSPFDNINLYDYLDRSKKTLQSFPGCDLEEELGHYFLRMEKDYLNDPRVKKLHETYNPSNLNFDYPEVIKFQYTKRLYERDYSYMNFIGGVVNFQLRDCKLQPGFASIKWPTVYKKMDSSYYNETFIYLEIPHEVILENMVSLGGHFYKKVLPTNGVQIVKNFVDEVEATCGWIDNIEVNKIIDKYDKIAPNWNHEFPIVSYSYVKKKGLIFPNFWILGPHHMWWQGLHRMWMPALARFDCPMILPKPIHDSKYYIHSVHKDFRKINGRYSRLLIEVDVKNKKLVFYLTTIIRKSLSTFNSRNPDKWYWEQVSETLNSKEVEYIGECKF